MVPNDWYADADFVPPFHARPEQFRLVPGVWWRASEQQAELVDSIPNRQPVPATGATWGVPGLRLEDETCQRPIEEV